MVSSRSILVGALLAVANSVYAQFEEGPSCDDYLVKIDNTTGISFYSTCPSIDAMVGPSHAFTGAFDLPGVKSIAQFSAGYLGPKLRGSERVDDRVTTVSMPDLVNTTSRGVLFGYLDNLTSVDFPKLETITGDLVLIDNYETKTLSLPALSNVTGGGLIDGPFDSISLPSLKSIGYLIVKSTGDLDCVALGKNLSSLIFTPKEYDSGVGFTCWTPDESNRYNSSDVTGTSGGNGSGSPTATGTAAAGTSSAASEAGSVMRMRGVGTVIGMVGFAAFVGMLL